MRQDVAETTGRRGEDEVATQQDLRTYRNPASRFVANTEIRHVDDLAQRFMTALWRVGPAVRRANGGADMTPRGDPPRCVQVLADWVITLSDRLGTNRTDAFENIPRGPGVGLCFAIPGQRDSPRVSGHAEIARDTTLESHRYQLRCKKTEEPISRNPCSAF